MKEHAKVPAEKNSHQQSVLTLKLIAGIILTVIIYMFSIPSSEDGRIYQTVLIFPIISILCGGYVFTYRPKNTDAIKIIFFVFTILSMLGIIALMYLMGMANAYSH